MPSPRDPASLKVSAIIPAYNEAKNILKVLEPLSQVPAIKEIIVVSDGSTDDTAQLSEGLGGIKVIRLPRNLGKTKAALKGVTEAEESTILFCDADLVNMNKDHVSDMIARYCEGYDMVIMDKGGQPWIFKSLLKSVPAVSGTRILEREKFLKVRFLETDRFQFEIRINDYFLANGLTIALSPAEEIHDTRKYVKYPFWKGLFLDIKGGWQVLASDGLPSIIRNLRTFQTIWKMTHSSMSSKWHKV